jgi:hypothetical protein
MFPPAAEEFEVRIIKTGFKKYVFNKNAKQDQLR